MQALGDRPRVGNLVSLAAGLAPKPVRHRATDAARIRTVDTWQGRMLIDRNDIYIGRSLLEYGEFARAEIELLTPWCRPGATVVDAGANIGVHSLAFARALGASGRLHAFEPQVHAHALLLRNLALHGCDRVQTHRTALSDIAGSLKMPAIDYRLPGNFGGLAAQADGPGRPVECLPLDLLRLPQVALIKIDVEGMEAAVLRGASRTIQRCRPVLYLENDRRDRSAALIELLWSMDYRLYWHTPPLFEPDNHAGNPHNLYPGVVSVNLLGLPAESGQTVKHLQPVGSAREHPLAPATT